MTGAMTQNQPENIDVAIVGGGPAGLMAAETAARAGFRAVVFDAMPSVGRKFLMAGRSGLNITHSEGFDAFVVRYGEAAPWLRPMPDWPNPPQGTSAMPWLMRWSFRVTTPARSWAATRRARPLFLLQTDAVNP